MDVTPLSDAKARLAAEVDGRAEVLLDVSHRIHARPELGYEERYAHDLLT
jgi:metal-dependent amidase/aminoacylase/carboxypeptidase family protein